MTDPAGDQPVREPATQPAPLKLDELKFTPETTRAGWLADHGNPRRIEGSGVQWLVYPLTDGRELWLWFARKDPQPLLAADVVTIEPISRTRVFDGTQNTPVR